MKVFGILLGWLVFALPTLLNAAPENGAKERLVAETFYRCYAPHAQRSVSDTPIKKVFDSHILFPASSHTESPTFQAFSFDRGGFVIVSSEGSGCRILGYSFDSSLSGMLPPPMLDYLTEVDSQIRAKEYAPLSSSEAGNEVVRLHTAAWGQDDPFNRLCTTANGSRALTGCVPTAYAILMQFHKWPLCAVEKKVYHSGTAEALLLGHPYDWDNMLSSYSGSFTEEQAVAVATLMRDLGYAYGVDYGVYSTPSGLGGEGAAKLIEFFDYRCESPDVSSSTCATVRDVLSNDRLWKSYIRQSLDAGCPIPYSSSASSGRHIFILDGYTDNDYFHFNWGWNGNGNGYFPLNEMKPDASSNYSRSHRAYFMLKPNRDDTSIERVNDNCSPDSKIIYQINGIRVQHPHVSGVYIVNGRPVWIDTTP